MDITHKSELVSYLKSHHFWTKKELGQNFLVDRDVLDKIVEAAELQPTDTVLEIGPGAGTLTWAIAPKVQNGLLLAVEKDFKLVELLRQEFKNAKQVKIVHDDIRRFDLCSIEGEYKVVANIPYYLTSPLIRKLLEARCDKTPVIAIPTLRREKQSKIQNSKLQTPNPNEAPKSNIQIQNHVPKLIVLTVQKEVAQRITAQPGDSNRGILTVMVELMACAEIIAEVPRTSFYPEPAVDSAIIRIRPRTTVHGPPIKGVICRPSSVDYALVMQVVKAGFSSKRRQLHNSLVGGLNLSSGQARELLEKVPVDPQKRAEDLTVCEWQALAKIWQKTLEK